MIIDSLTHVTPDGRWFHTNHDSSVERLLAEMDAANMDKAVVVALAEHIDNEFVLKTCARSEGRLIPGASLNPCASKTPEAAAAEAKELLKGGDYAVLKLHPRLNGYDPLDPRCLAVFDTIVAEGIDVPIWLDTIFQGSGCVLRQSPVETIHALAHRCKGHPFVLVHGGGANLLRLAEFVGAFDNLYLDLSLTALYYAGSSLDSDLDFILSKRDQRTIVGSDFPEYVPSQYIDRIRHRAEVLGLPESKVDAVLGGNLARLLGRWCE